MTTVIQFAVLGLGAGAVYTLLAQGMVLVYRGSGVLNFAHGAFAMAGAFVFISLRQDHAWAFVPALLAVIVVGTSLGLITQMVFLRRLRNASSLSRVIATLAVLLTLQAIGILIWGPNSVFVQPIFPLHVFRISHVLLPEQDVILAAAAVVMTVLLWAMYRYSTIGMSMRAAAENRRGIAALGWSPDLLAAINWGLGGALAALAGMFLAPLTGANVANLDLLVIPALAAVLIGRFQSLPLVLLGGMAIGIAQSEMANYVSQEGFSDSLPFAVIIVVLVIRGTSLPTRGYVSDRFAALGSGVVRWRGVAVGTAIAAVLVAFAFTPALNNSITTSLVWGIILLSIVVLTGYAGQLSLAQVAFGGIAALISAKLIDHAGFGFVPALVVGVLATVPVGLLFGLPAVRTRGVNLAAVTLGLGLAVEAIVFSNPTYIDGMGTPVGTISFFGLSLDTATHTNRYAVFVLLVFIGCLLSVASIRRGRVGRRMIAVKTNERAAAALGISVVGTKLYAFGLAAGIAGLGGALLGFQNSTVIYDPYTPTNSIFALAYAVIGGVGYVIGPLFGLFFAAGGIGNYITETILPGINQWVALIGGVVLLLILMQDPNGLASMNVKALRPDEGPERMSKLAYLRPEVLIVRAYSTLRTRFRGARPQKAREQLPQAERRRVTPATLTASGVTVRFGGVTAVNDVSLVVEPGQVVGLIGPNGAGKTTFIDAVTGFVRPGAGVVRLGERRIDGWPVHRRARAGISRSFQSLELFEDITVRENLRAASDRRDRLAYLTNLIHPRNQPLPPAAIAAIREFGLEDDLDVRPADLPYGRRRLVAVARAVASEPSVLLLDEPAAGLDEAETAELARLVRGLARNWGIAVLVVEHDMSFVMNTCDQLTVLDFGLMIAQGETRAVGVDPRVVAAYLGEAVEGDEPQPLAPLAPQITTRSGKPAQ